jgi:hypothetical protein
MRLGGCALKDAWAAAAAQRRSQQMERGSPLERPIGVCIPDKQLSLSEACLHIPLPPQLPNFSSFNHHHLSSTTYVHPQPRPPNAQTFITFLQPLHRYTLPPFSTGTASSRLQLGKAFSMLHLHRSAHIFIRLHLHQSTDTFIHLHLPSSQAC